MAVQTKTVERNLLIRNLNNQYLKKYKSKKNIETLYNIFENYIKIVLN